MSLENHSNQNIVTPDIPSPQVKEEAILVTPASPPSLSTPQTPSQTHTFTEQNDTLHMSYSQRLTSPRRGSLTRRNRGRHTPFERVAEQIVAIERRRLMYEEERDKRLHEREMERIKLEAERLRLETERLAVTRQQTSLLHQLSYLGQRLIEIMTEQQTVTTVS